MVDAPWSLEESERLREDIRDRVNDHGGAPRKTSETRGEILKVREGELNR